MLTRKCHKWDFLTNLQQKKKKKKRAAWILRLISIKKKPVCFYICHGISSKVTAADILHNFRVGTAVHLTCTSLKELVKKLRCSVLYHYQLTHFYN